MSRTVHYVSGDLTMRSRQTAFLSPPRAHWRGYCRGTEGVFGMDSAGWKERRWSALMDWTLVCQTEKTSGLVEAHSNLALQLMFISSVEKQKNKLEKGLYTEY